MAILMIIPTLILIHTLTITITIMAILMVVTITTDTIIATRTCTGFFYMSWQIRLAR